VGEPSPRSGTTEAERARLREGAGTGNATSRDSAGGRAPEAAAPIGEGEPDPRRTEIIASDNGEWGIEGPAASAARTASAERANKGPCATEKKGSGASTSMACSSVSPGAGSASGRAGSAKADKERAGEEGRVTDWRDMEQGGRAKTREGSGNRRTARLYIPGPRPIRAPTAMRQADCDTPKP
jgi:hypothetical protein